MDNVNIQQLEINVKNNSTIYQLSTPYIECSSDASVSKKIILNSGVSSEASTQITIKFIYGNTSSTSTLSIWNDDETEEIEEKNIVWNNIMKFNALEENGIVKLVSDGNNWQIVG